MIRTEYGTHHPDSLTLAYVESHAGVQCSIATLRAYLNEGPVDDTYDAAHALSWGLDDFVEGSHALRDDFVEGICEHSNSVPDPDCGCGT